MSKAGKGDRRSAAAMVRAVEGMRALVTLAPIPEFAMLVLVGAATYGTIMLLINRRGVDDVLRVVLHRR